MLTIYLCEDEEDIRQVQRECLEKQILIQGYDMEVALCSGRPGEILEAVKAAPGRGIYFLDVELKGEEMDGFALGREIRRLDPRGFIVYVTAYGNLAFETFRYHLEALDYIVKESREFFSVKVMDVVKHVPINEIMFFEAAPGTRRIALHGLNDWFDFIGSLRELEGQMGKQFLRAHRAYLVNLEQIAELDLKGRELRMKNGERCLFARNMKGALLERM